MNTGEDTAGGMEGSAQMASGQSGAAGSSGGGWRIVVLLVLAVLAVLVLAGWWSRRGPASVELGDVAAAGDAVGLNVLLVTMDTTRADHLGCYGYKAGRTPHIDALLEHGVRFDHTYTTVPVTLPAHTSIMTGRYPYHHGVRNNGTYELPEQETTLAEVLKAEGYDTAAFVSAFVLDERYGLSQGFDVYNFEASEEGRRSPQSLAIEREAHRVTSKAIEWLEDERKGGGDAPFFLWVHYYDPHAPYRSPLLKAIGADDLPLPAAYTAEIEFMDLHMGRLFDQLRKMGIDSRTLKVIVADHGEMLGEHGEIEHGGFIYESAMHVPFILSCDALFEGAYRVDDRIVSTVDITPTVLALLGIQPPKALDGVDLAAGTAEPDRAVYMETLYTRESMGAAPLYGLRRLNDKFILAPRSEYYDLREDPEEQVNLYGRKDSAIQELEGQLKDLVASRSDEPSAARSMSAEELAKLEALGYIGATEQVDRGALPDPKDQIPMLAELGEARRMMNEERYDEALEIAIGILDRTQCVNPAVLLVCETYAKMNRREAGVEVLEDYVRECSTVDVLIILSQQLFLLGRYQEMLRHLEAAELMDAREGSVPMLRGEYAAKIGDYDEALKQFKKALDIDAQRIGPDAQKKIAEVERKIRSQEP